MRCLFITSSLSVSSLLFFSCRLMDALQLIEIPVQTAGSQILSGAEPVKKQRLDSHSQQVAKKSIQAIPLAPSRRHRCKSKPSVQKPEAAVVEPKVEPLVQQLPATVATDQGVPGLQWPPIPITTVTMPSSVSFHEAT